MNGQNIQDYIEAEICHVAQDACPSVTCPTSVFATWAKTSGHLMRPGSLP